jgi:hypothetical protein
MELLMLVIGGRERTEGDFRSLLTATGFALTRIIPTEAPSLIECRPVKHSSARRSAYSAEGGQ